MNKLIKLSDTHYIVVDDSEIKAGDWVLTKENTIHQVDYIDAYTKINNWKKITHSTQPLEEDIEFVGITPKITLGFINIKPLSLSEVEEALYGYNYHTLAKEACIKYGIEIDFVQPYTLFIEGFKAHQELVKDKLFTAEDLYVAFSCGRTYEKSNHHSVGQNELVDYIKSLKKTEWDIEFNEQGKIKLI